MRHRFLQAATLAVAGILMVPAARAQAVWVGGTSDYNAASNWSGDTLPANNGTATLDFPAPGPQQQVQISTNVNVLGVDFTGSGNSGFNFFTPNGLSPTFTIGAGGVQQSINSNASFSLPVVLSASQTWDGTSGWVVAYDGVNETGGSQTLTTLGTIYLLGPGTYTGGTNISSGSTVNVEGEAVGTGTITISASGSLVDWYGTAVLPNAVVLLGDATLGSQGTNQNNNNLELDGPITLSTTAPTINVGQGGFVISKGAISAPAFTTLTLSGSSAISPKDGGSLMVVSGPTSSGIQGLTLSSIAVILDPTATPSTAFGSISGSGFTMENDSYLGFDGTYVTPGAVSNFLSSNATSLSSGSLSGSIGFDTFAGGEPNEFVDPIDLSGISSGTFFGLGSSTYATLDLAAVITPHNEQYLFGGGGGTLTVKSPLVDDGGTPRSLKMTAAPGNLTLLLQGTNSYTGGTMSDGGVLIFDSPTPTTGQIDAGTGYVGYAEGATNITTASDFIALFNKSASYGVIGFDSDSTSDPRTIGDDLDLTSFTSSLFIGTATAVIINSSVLTPVYGAVHNNYQFTGVKGGALTIQSYLTDSTAGAIIGLVNPIESNESVSSVTMSGDNGYGMGTVFNSGVLYVTTENSLGYGPVSVPNNGTAAVAPVLASVDGDTAIDNNISVAQFQGGNGSPGLILGNATTTDRLTLQGVISDGATPGTIGIQGVVGLGGTNTYSGDTYFTGVGYSDGVGVAYVSNNSAFGIGTIYTTSAGTIVPDGVDVNISNPIQIQQTLTLGRAGNENMLTLSGPITQNGVASPALDIESNVTLTGVNTFSGNVVVNDALLVISDASALGTSTLQLNGSSLQYSSPTPTVENLQGDSASSVSLATSQLLTLDVPSGNSDDFAGVISGDSTNGVKKTGAGTQILENANVYGGGTEVSGGILLANGSQSLGTGTVTVDNGATLGVGPSATLTNPLSVISGGTIGGDGTYSPTGGVSVNSGMIVQPYNTTGSVPVANLSFGTTLTFGPTGVYNFAVMTALGSAGIDYSTITESGALSITATSGYKFVLDVKSFVPGTDTAGLASFNAMSSYSWTILTAASISGFSSSVFSIDTSSFQNPLMGGSFNLAQVGNTLTLDFTPVPEPSTWVLIPAGLCLVGFGIRRRARA